MKVTLNHHKEDPKPYDPVAEKAAQEKAQRKDARAAEQAEKGSDYITDNLDVWVGLKYLKPGQLPYFSEFAHRLDDLLDRADHLLCSEDYAKVQKADLFDTLGKTIIPLIILLEHLKSVLLHQPGKVYAPPDDPQATFDFAKEEHTDGLTESAKLATV